MIDWIIPNDCYHPGVPLTSQRALASITAGGIAVLALSACGSDGPSSSAQEPTRTAASGASSTPSPTAKRSPDATPTGPVDPCLLSIKEVSHVLAGSWSVSEHTDVLCLYNSDRGAIFAIQNVLEPDVQGGLASARSSSCDTKPRAVRRTNSFACVERKEDGDLVVGNIIAHDNLWVLVIVVGDDGDHDAELDAMTALLGQVRT